VLDPLWAIVFDAVDGYYVPSCHAILMVRYATAEPSNVSVLRIMIHDPGGAEWSHR
jgi:hypothetical protein